MNYQEAEDLAYRSEWATKECGSKEVKDCWCRLIVPKQEIRYDSHSGEKDAEVFYFVPSGSIDKKLAEYIVKLHNEKIKQA